MKHFYRDDTDGTWVHESNAIDAADAALFEADRRAWEAERSGGAG